MRDLVERTYFAACLALGKLLRSGTYARTRIVHGEHGSRQVRKRRLFHAPLLIWLGDGLMTLLDTGVRVLPQHEWEERERLAYRSLYGASDQAMRIDDDGTLVLPWLPGRTLATLLEDPTVDEPLRSRLIAWAVIALSKLHRLGWTHGDAMAENVMIDVAAGRARWFDFETVHASNRSRPPQWRRADDVRALLATCLVRTAPERRAETVQRVLDVYADEPVSHLLAESFGTVLQRPLTFHLGQAPLSLESYREIARALERSIP